MACRFQGGKCTVRIKAGTENQKVWIEYQQQKCVQYSIFWKNDQYIFGTGFFKMMINHWSGVAKYWNSEVA